MKKIIILAGGFGYRTNLGFPKQFFSIQGEMIINILLKKIVNLFDSIILVLNEHKLSENIFKNKKIKIAKPGMNRLESIKSGLRQSNIKPEDKIFIHDAARIMLSKEDVDLHLKWLKTESACVSVAPSIDTMFLCSNGYIQKAYKKQIIWRGLTPQSYRGDVLLNNLEKIYSFPEEKDLTEIILNTKFKILEQIADLRKITTKKDICWLKDKI